MLARGMGVRRYWIREGDTQRCFWGVLNSDGRCLALFHRGENQRARHEGWMGMFPL